MAFIWVSGMQKIVDSRGFACPLPVIQMEAALRHLNHGESLLVLADDPIAMIDIPHFCQEGGHTAQKLSLLELERTLKSENPAYYSNIFPLKKRDICVFMVTAGRKTPFIPPKTP